MLSRFLGQGSRRHEEQDVEMDSMEAGRFEHLQEDSEVRDEPSGGMVSDQPSEEEEAEGELAENTTNDDPFLFFAGDDLDDEDDDDEDDQGRRKTVGWECRNDEARVAKRISRHLFLIKSQELLNGPKSKPRKNTPLKKAEEDALNRAAQMGRNKCCSFLPKRANHIYMGFLCWILMLTIGTGLLVAGLMGEEHNFPITRSETRLISIPSTWWFDCLNFERMTIRGTDGRSRRETPTSNEIQFYVYDASSPPKYHSTPHEVRQTKDVPLSMGDSSLYYLQFYINQGGEGSFNWFFTPEDSPTPSPLDVLWVRGYNNFHELASAGDNPDAEAMARWRIPTSLLIGNYRTTVNISDDYFLVFRHWRGDKSKSSMRGKVTYSMKLPFYDLTNPSNPPRAKYSGLGSVCFPFRSETLLIMASDFEAESDRIAPGELILVNLSFSKRLSFSMSFSGTLFVLIFCPIICGWGFVTCREWHLKKRKSLRSSSTSNANLNANPEQQPPAQDGEPQATARRLAIPAAAAPAAEGQPEPEVEAPDAAAPAVTQTTTTPPGPPPINPHLQMTQEEEDWW